MLYLCFPNPYSKAYPMAHAKYPVTPRMVGAAFDLAQQTANQLLYQAAQPVDESRALIPANFPHAWAAMVLAHAPYATPADHAEFAYNEIIAALPAAALVECWLRVYGTPARDAFAAFYVDAGLLEIGEPTAQPFSKTRYLVPPLIREAVASIWYWQNAGT